MGHSLFLACFNSPAKILISQIVVGLESATPPDKEAQAAADLVTEVAIAHDADHDGYKRSIEPSSLRQLFFSEIFFRVRPPANRVLVDAVG